jgi:hypothetical protein
MHWCNYPKNYVQTTSHEDPHNAKSSSPLLLPPSKPQTSSSAACSEHTQPMFLP